MFFFISLVFFDRKSKMKGLLFVGWPWDTIIFGSMFFVLGVWGGTRESFIGFEFLRDGFFMDRN